MSSWRGILVPSDREEETRLTSDDLEAIPYMCASMHVHVHVGTFVCENACILVCIHIWRPKNNLRCHF